MCGPNIYASQLRELDGMTLTRAERLAGSEASREEHRRLWEAVRDAHTIVDYDTAKRAWDDHIEGHRAAAARIRAEREK